MPHIHPNKDEHDLTVTAYIVRTDTPEPQALLHMHRKLNVLLPVGGHVEILETPWQAASHEIEEEAGYEFNQLQILQPKSRIKGLSKVALHPNPLSMNTHAIPGDHFHTDIEYGFIATGEPKLSVEDGESLDIRWFTQSEMNQLGSKDIFDNTKEIYNFIFDEALENWELLPTDDFILEFPEDYK
jgi:ADP-ribose pyrophosphatase YjhB (NUDIX family)